VPTLPSAQNAEIMGMGHMVGTDTARLPREAAAWFPGLNEWEEREGA
jgi:hypothetical protein